MMRKVRVAIIGCGFASQGHFASWKKVPQATVVAICDADQNILKRASRFWKIDRCYLSSSELLDYKDVDVWDIITPPQYHATLAVQAMKAGFNVLLEKPMTLTIEDAKSILECQESMGVKVGVVHNWLFEPPVLRARKIIEQGKIGEIVGAQIDTIHTKDEPMAANKNHWCHKLPGGRFSEVLAHPIYLLRYFLGDIKVRSLEVSKIGEYPWMKYDELRATFTDGQRLGGAYVSFNAPRDAIFIDVFGRDGLLRLDVITATLCVLPRAKMSRFQKGVDSIRQASQLLTSTLENAVSILSKRWTTGLGMCIRLFAESLRNSEPPPVTVHEGFVAVKVLETLIKMIENVSERNLEMKKSR